MENERKVDFELAALDANAFDNLFDLVEEA
jgi:hypothetical protein